MHTASKLAVPEVGDDHKNSAEVTAAEFFVLEILRAGVAVPTSCAPVAVNEPAVVLNWTLYSFDSTIASGNPPMFSSLTSLSRRATLSATLSSLSRVGVSQAASADVRLPIGRLLADLWWLTSEGGRSNRKRESLVTD